MDTQYMEILERLKTRHLLTSSALSAEKAACRENLLCETKNFEIMTDITFAKAHMGEYFQLRGHKVRVIGYDTTGIGNSVIVSHPCGWAVELIDPIDVINGELCETGRCQYVKWEDLK